MTATLAEVRNGIAEVLRSLDGIDTVYAYRHGSPTPPCATVGWPDLWTPATYLNSDAWETTIPVQILVATGDNASADRNLAAFFDPSGPSSVSALFDAHSTLDGVLVTGYAIVRSVNDIGVARFADEGIDYLAATFNIEVMAS